MKIAILISLLFGLIKIYAQSGFFGAHNGLEVRVNTMPHDHNSFRLSDDGSEVKINHKYGILKYALNYSRIVSRHGEIGIGYSYNTINANSGESFIRVVQAVTYNGEPGYFYSSQQAIDDVRVPFHHFHFHYRYYRSGSLAPVGKYIGLSFNSGTALLKEGTPVYVGGRDVPTSRNFTNSLAEVMFLDTLYSHEIKYQYFQIAGTMGRSYILSRKITLNGSVTLPFFTLSHINDKWKFPIPIVDDIMYLLWKKEYVHENATDPNFYGLFVSPIRRYINVTFDFGLKYHF